MYLLDTPGFDDSKGHDDDQIIDTILEELNRLFKGGTHLKGILYLYDMSAYRIGGMTAKVSPHELRLRSFEKLMLIRS